MAVVLNQNFEDIETNYRLRGGICGICGHWKTRPDKHAKTHTGSKKALICGDEVTFDKSKADDWQNRQRGMQEPHDPDILELVRKMRKSTPAKIRFYGGMFLEGPLRWQKIPGQPRYFERSGRLKRRYMDVLGGSTANQSKAPRPVRACNIKKSSSYINEIWDRDPDNKTFTEIETNCFTKNKYSNWQVPGFISGQSPTWIPPGQRQCMYCNITGCSCITTKVSKSKPRICSTGDGMGEGVQATDTHEKGEMVGELVGDIAPLGQFSDGWAAELERNDLSEDKKYVSWCLIYPRYSGNWVRKVNHSCEPNCVFVARPISGLWRMMVQAIRRIEKGSWITVSYGNEYWRSPGERCLCGSENCVSGPQSQAT